MCHGSLSASSLCLFSCPFCTHLCLTGSSPPVYLSQSLGLSLCCPVLSPHCIFLHLLPNSLCYSGFDFILFSALGFLSFVVYLLLFMFWILAPFYFLSACLSVCVWVPCVSTSQQLVSCINKIKSFIILVQQHPFKNRQFSRQAHSKFKRLELTGWNTKILQIYWVVMWK